MKKAASIAAAAAIAAAAFVGDMTAAQAQASRTFVSGEGTDSGTCGRTAPCRSFAYAINQTASAGEIVVLDSAGYGPVTINQSVSITNPGGVEAGITAPAGQNAISISAGPPASVTLRGLTLEGGGIGGNGIVVSSDMATSATSTLNLLNCVIKDFTGNGVAVQAFGLGNMVVNIADSFIQNNSSDGVLIASSGPPESAFIYRSLINGNGTGIALNNGSTSTAVTAVIESSHIDNNTASAITNASNINAGVMMIGSTALRTNNGTSTDITNNGALLLLEGNAVSNINNKASGLTDGTNYIGILAGNTLLKQSPQ